RNLQPPLGAVREVAGGIVGALDQPDLVEPHAGLLDRALLRPPIGARPEHAEKGEAGRDHQRIVLGHQQVLERRHAGEQADVLECAGDSRLLRHQVVGHALEQEQRAAMPPHAAGAAVGHRLQLLPHGGIAVVQRDPPFGGLVEAGDAVEDGGLAGAVGPDQRGDLPARRREAKVADGNEPAEAHGQVLDAQHRICAGGDHPRPSLTRSAEMVRASRNTADGSRVAIRPRGFQIMISTMAKPNSNMRYCVGSKSLPNKALRKSSSRVISVPPIMTMAAIATPIWLPMPPSTTMERMVAASRKVNDSGAVKPCRAAKNEPAKPANMPPMANAVSFVLVVLMPSARQAISSSRNASQARPTGRRRSRMVT